jgi:putative thioredoxin
MGYDVRDFERDVLERSRQVPVLVDFWAPWCGPCRTLGPVLERLAAEAGGRWELVKVNTEENEQLALAFEIRSIPAVKLFRDGDVVDEFVGALPEAEIRRWIERAIPSPGQSRLDEARTLLAAGQRARAEELARGVLAADPANSVARVLLAEAVLLDAPSEAASLVENIREGDELAERADTLRALAALLSRGTDEAHWPAALVRPVMTAGVQALTQGDFDAALRSFIEVIARDKTYADSAAPAACKAIFQLLGIRHPIVERHYRAFASALHA